METAPLKSFATTARTELIREVGARITAVLAQGSPERVEQPKAVTALERAIAQGALTVEYVDRRITYRSMDDLLKAYSMVKGAVDAATAGSGRVYSTFASFSKG